MTAARGRPSIRPYGDPARREVEDHQGLAEAGYYTARAALNIGHLTRAVGLQETARINSVAARAAYQAWLEVKR